MPLEIASSLKLLYAHQPLAEDVLAKLQSYLRIGHSMVVSSAELVRSLNDYSAGLSEFEEDPAAVQAHKAVDKLADLFSRVSSTMSDTLSELDEGASEPMKEYLNGGSAGEIKGNIVAKTRGSLERLAKLQTQHEQLKKKYKETAAGRKATPAKIKEILEEQETVKANVTQTNKELGTLAEHQVAELADKNARLFISVTKILSSRLAQASSILADFSPYCDSFEVSSSTSPAPASSLSFESAQSPPTPEPTTPSLTPPIPSSSSSSSLSSSQKEQSAQQRPHHHGRSKSLAEQAITAQEVQQVTHQIGKIIELEKNHLELLNKLVAVHEKMVQEQTNLKISAMTVSQIFHGIPEAIDVNKEILSELEAASTTSPSSHSKMLADILSTKVNRMTEIYIFIVKGMTKLVQELDLSNVAVLNRSGFPSSSSHKLFGKTPSLSVSQSKQSKKIEVFDKKYEVRFMMASTSRHLHQLKAVCQLAFEHTNPKVDIAGWNSLHDCLEAMGAALDRIDDSRIEGEQILQLVSVKKTKLIDLELDPVRPFLYDGEVTLPTSVKKYRLFLFSDSIVLGEEIALTDDETNAGKYKTYVKAKLTDTALSSGAGMLKDTNAFKLQFASGITPESIVCICSAESYATWTKMLETAIAQRRKTECFGAPLEKQLTQAKGRPVPAFIERLAEVIEAAAPTTEGIYRLSASASEITKLKARLDEGKKQFINEWLDPLVATGLLKVWFRELPEPLSFMPLYEQWRDVDPENVSALKEIIATLPPIFRGALGWLCLHLNRVAKYAQESKMDAANLAIVFQPALFRHPPDMSEQSFLLQSPTFGKITVTLIEHAQEVFTSETETEPLEDSSKGSVETISRRNSTCQKREKRRTTLLNRSVASDLPPSASSSSSDKPSSPPLSSPLSSPSVNSPASSPPLAPVSAPTVSEVVLTPASPTRAGGSFFHFTAHRTASANRLLSTHRTDSATDHNLLPPPATSESGATLQVPGGSPPPNATTEAVPSVTLCPPSPSPPTPITAATGSTARTSVPSLNMGLLTKSTLQQSPHKSPRKELDLPLADPNMSTVVVPNVGLGAASSMSVIDVDLETPLSARSARSGAYSASLAAQLGLPATPRSSGVEALKSPRAGVIPVHHSHGSRSDRPNPVAPRVRDTPPHETPEDTSDVTKQ